MRSEHNTWVVRPSIPALAFSVYQQHHSDVLWFWPALPLPTYSKEPLHFPSSDDGNGIRLDRFIHQESEERKKYSAGMSLHCACCCPLKKRRSFRLSFNFIAFQCSDSCQTNDMFYIHHNLYIFVCLK